MIAGYTDPCKHHCNPTATEFARNQQAVQEKNSSVQKFVRTRVNGGLSCITAFSVDTCNLGFKPPQTSLFSCNLFLRK